jgi:hypothetical protein
MKTTEFNAQQLMAILLAKCQSYGAYAILPEHGFGGVFCGTSLRQIARSGGGVLGLGKDRTKL